MSNRLALLALITWLGSGLTLPAFSIPEKTAQLLIVRPAGWDSTEATLQRWQRTSTSDPWQPVGTPLPVRLGKNGLAWGLGLHPPQPGLQKKEGDGRAPAGVFTLGGVYGDAPDVPRHPSLPYRQVTPSDLWVEDADSPFYNQHLVLPDQRLPSTPWEKKQQMKQADPAHKLKLFIAHNAATPRAAPGAGSAIFFHIWRENGARPSTGCTVMPESALLEMIAWLQPDRHPLYILLPEEEYRTLRSSWRLP